MITLPPGFTLSTVFTRAGIVHAVLSKQVACPDDAPDSEEGWMEAQCQVAIGQGTTPERALERAILDAVGDA